MTFLKTTLITDSFVFILYSILIPSSVIGFYRIKNRYTQMSKNQLVFSSLELAALLHANTYWYYDRCTMNRPIL